MDRVLTTVVLLVFAAPAGAFSCYEATLEEKVHAVDTIAFAVLLEARILDEDFQQASATFRVHEFLKGAVDSEFVVTTSANFGTGDGVPLLLGMHYLLFFDSNSMIVSSCGGSGRAGTEQVAEVRQVVEAQRPRN